MFADDGVILTETDIDVKRMLRRPDILTKGIKLARDKPFGVATLFRFLGLDYDLENRLVSYTKKGTKEFLMLNIDTASEAELEALSKYAIYGSQPSQEMKEERRLDPLSMMGKVRDWMQHIVHRNAIR